MKIKIQSFQLDINCTPFELFQSLPLESGTILLESTMTEHSLGKRSIIVTNPKRILSLKKNILCEVERDVSKKILENPLNYIRKILSENQFAYDGDEFCGGLVGYLSYDFGCSFENVLLTKPCSTNLPEIFLGVYDWGLTYYHDKKQWVIAGRDDLQTQIDFIKDCLAANLQTSLSTSSSISLDSTNDNQLISNFTRDEYLSAVQKVKAYITEGDIYQVNLTQQFSTTVTDSALNIYTKLRLMNPAPFSAMICVDKNSYVLSSSPELFLDIRDKFVETRPIKGTLPRGQNELEDEQMKRTLFESQKDTAELMMIVDLERNDLNRVCEVGSVQVPNLKMIETYAKVHHLVARVVGKIKPENDLMDLLYSIFPGGSITGAPKIRAMQIINELEQNRRGVYTGTIGYIGFNDKAMLNIAIRTLTYENGKVTIGVGGGIVADSDPEKEYQETLYKGAAMFEALGIRNEKLKMQNVQGVFETLRAYNGIPFKLNEHLQRLNKSLSKLGFTQLKEENISQSVNNLLGLKKLKSARIRIAVTHGVNNYEANRQKINIEIFEFERTIPDYALVMVCEEKLIHGDDLRLHKIDNNIYYNSIFEKAKSMGYDEAIFIDSENHILEGTRSNIFLVKDNIVYTPLLDCGVLPGITRKIVIDILDKVKIECVEKFLDASELENIDEVFLTNSINEIVPVKKIGNKEFKSFDFAKMISREYQYFIQK